MITSLSLMTVSAPWCLSIWMTGSTGSPADWEESVYEILGDFSSSHHWMTDTVGFRRVGDLTHPFLIFLCTVGSWGPRVSRSVSLTYLIRSFSFNSGSIIYRLSSAGLLCLFHSTLGIHRPFSHIYWRSKLKDAPLWYPHQGCNFSSWVM